MPVMRTYQCPECEGQFDHLHLRSTDEPPAFCPLCGTSTAEVTPEVSAPHIARSIGKSADAVYRGMEEGSQQRAAMAAEHLGVDVSEMSAMKVTNLRDDARPGETSAATVSNPVSQYMGQTGVGGLHDSQAGAAYASAASTGPFARAGSAALSGVVGQHAAMASRVAAAGCQGKY